LLEVASDLGTDLRGEHETHITKDFEIKMNLPGFHCGFGVIEVAERDKGRRLVSLRML